MRGEEKDSLQGQERKINSGPQDPHLDQRGSGEMQAIQITVEDLGIVNSSFSLFEEDLLTPGTGMACSASSVCACTRALKKKRLKPLSSLPIQAKMAATCTSVEDDEEEEEDTLLFGSGTNSTAASGSLLTQPVINLIPPTPSDVADDDQFFDINSEESVAHTSGSDGSFAAGDEDSYKEKTERVETEESSEEFTVAESKVSADGAATEEGQSDQLGEDKEPMPTEVGDKEKTKPRFLRSIYQVAPLPECSQKSESNCNNISSADSLKPYCHYGKKVCLLTKR